MRIGLTGGMGSGKSTVAGMLEKLGACVVDADAISRASTAPNGSAISAIRSAFGAGMLTPEGALDREQMRKLVFANNDAKVTLERIVHPLVALEITAQAQAAEAAGSHCIVFDIPLLVESGHWRQSLQRILVVDCTEATQVARIASRNQLGVEEIQRILATQATRDQRLAAADLVIFNDANSMDELASKVKQVGTQFGL